MKVIDASSELYRLPLNGEWGDQTHRITDIELVVLDLLTDSGIEGVGFSYTVGLGGAALRALIDSELIPMILGKTAHPSICWNWMWSQMHDAGGGGLTTMALAAVDIALWDAMLKRHNERLVDYLGQVRPRMRAYGSGVNLNYSLDDLRDQVATWVSRGYQAVKIKVGCEDLSEDLERIDIAIKTAQGIPLMLDANQGWDLTTAIHRIRAFDKLNILWIEEPLIADDILGHVELRSKASTPIAVGENLYNCYQFRDYLVQRGCDIVQADVVRVGGITPFLEIAQMANVWGLNMAPHFMLELSGQLLCCIPNAGWVEDVDGGSLSELGVLETRIQVENGFFVPPAAPGHGIIFDRTALRPFAHT